MKGNCSTCACLDKNKKRTACGAYQYGCKSKKWGGWIPCWINADHLLEDLHCGSAWMPIVETPRQMTIEEMLLGETAEETEKQMDIFDICI